MHISITQDRPGIVMASWFSITSCFFMVSVYRKVFSLYIMFVVARFTWRINQKLTTLAFWTFCIHRVDNRIHMASGQETAPIRELKLQWDWLPYNLVKSLQFNGKRAQKWSCHFTFGIYRIFNASSIQSGLHLWGSTLILTVQWSYYSLIFEDIGQKVVMHGSI